MASVPTVLMALTLFLTFLQPAFCQELKQIGDPVGGNGGKLFDDTARIPDSSKVTKVLVRHGELIDAIRIVHDDVDLDWHGGEGGHEEFFQLAPDEYIISISGQYGQFIDSLYIHTSTGRVSKLCFGGRGGHKSYNFTAPDGYEIVGFFGRSGQWIDSIGVIARKINE